MDQIFDLESVYDEQISPLMQQIIAICNEHQMPMVCSFAFENCEERGVGDCTTILNAYEGRVHMPFNKAFSQIRGGNNFIAAFAIKSVTNGDDHA
jgi:hypothetical protein